jgi:hypothetical protein
VSLRNPKSTIRTSAHRSWSLPTWRCRRPPRSSADLWGQFVVPVQFVSRERLSPTPERMHCPDTLLRYEARQYSSPHLFGWSVFVYGPNAGMGRAAKLIQSSSVQSSVLVGPGEDSFQSGGREFEPPAVHHPLLRLFVSVSRDFPIRPTCANDVEDTARVAAASSWRRAYPALVSRNGLTSTRTRHAAAATNTFV